MQVEQFKIKDIGKPFKKIDDVAKDVGGKVVDTSKVVSGKVVDTSKVVGGFAQNIGGKVAGFGKKIGGAFKSIFTKLWKFLMMLFKNWRIVLSVICGLCILSVVARVASIGRLLGLGSVFSSRAVMRQRGYN
jgi:hypothetical protein